jgi:glutamate 5-kinase
MKRAAVLAEDVLDCSGRFSIGDSVYVTFRGRDGGQYAIATGIVRCDDTMLRKLTGQPTDARGNSVIVIEEQDLKLLWPSISAID